MPALCWARILAPGGAEAQIRFSAPSSQFELSETVQFDRADGAALAHLERAKACLAEHQWDEAVETLRQVMENAEGKLLAVTPWRYVNLSDACQLQLAALPPEALKLYRRRVDPVAQKWYEEGLARRDAKLLENVVQQAFASSWGDKALMALGEMRLEEGDFSAARWCWERILPVRSRPARSTPGPAIPIRRSIRPPCAARLVLVSILEGSPSRAREELSAVRPPARRCARAAGRPRGPLCRRLGGTVEPKRLVAEGQAGAGLADIRRFAGPQCDRAGVDRRGRRPMAGDVQAADSPAAGSAGTAWFGRGRQSARHRPVAGVSSRDQPGARVRRRSSRDLRIPHRYRPAGLGRRRAVDLPRARRDVPLAMPGPGEALGTPRYTLTIADGRLYARMGSPITNPPQQPGVSVAAGSIVCLDLRAEGKLLWKVAAEEGWAFDGAPVVAGARLFVTMRRNDIRPQAHVACFDTTTGRMRWRRFVCAAETPARGTLAECTHTLLTLAGGTIYVNTNLGAVASLAVEDGRINWLSLYPRVRSGNLLRMDAHWQRDLNPCLFDHGRLYVAPADSPRVYALDAATGQILWPGRHDDRPAETPVQDPLDDVVHLLGVSGDCLIASGHKLYWIDIAGPRAGNIAHVWPEGGDKLGYGRGLLAGDYVLWPTREKIYVFHQQTARLKKEIELAPLGVRGGNLLVADGRLLIATPSELIVLGTNGGTKKEPRAEIT